MTVDDFCENHIKNKRHSWEEKDTFFDWMTAQQQIQ